MCKRTLLRASLFFALIAVPATLLAESNSHQEIAQKLIKVMGTKDTIQRELGPLGGPNWSEIEGDMVQVYQDTFTEEELKALLEFYESPTGKMLLRKEPQLMARSREVLARHTLDAMSTLGKAMAGYKAALDDLQESVSDWDNLGKKNKPNSASPK